MCLDDLTLEVFEQYHRDDPIGLETRLLRWSEVHDFNMNDDPLAPRIYRSATEWFAGALYLAACVHPWRLRRIIPNAIIATAVVTSLLKRSFTFARRHPEFVAEPPLALPDLPWLDLIDDESQEALVHSFGRLAQAEVEFASMPVEYVNIVPRFFMTVRRC